MFLSKIGVYNDDYDFRIAPDKSSSSNLIRSMSLIFIPPERVFGRIDILTIRKLEQDWKIEPQKNYLWEAKSVYKTGRKNFMYQTKSLLYWKELERRQIFSNLPFKKTLR